MNANQQAIAAYVEKHKLNEKLLEMVTAMVAERPETIHAWMSAYISKHHCARRTVAVRIAPTKDGGVRVSFRRV